MKGIAIGRAIKIKDVGYLIMHPGDGKLYGTSNSKIELFYTKTPGPYGIYKDALEWAKNNFTHSDISEVEIFE